MYYSQVRSNFRVATVYQNRDRSRSYLTLQWEKGKLAIYDMQSGLMERIKPTMDSNGVMKVTLDNDLVKSSCIDKVNTKLLRIIGLEGILLRHRQLLREATHKVSLALRDKSDEYNELLLALDKVKMAQEYLRRCDRKNFRNKEVQHDRIV